MFFSIWCLGISLFLQHTFLSLHTMLLFLIYTYQPHSKLLMASRHLRSYEWLLLNFLIFYEQHSHLLLRVASCFFCFLLLLPHVLLHSFVYMYYNIYITTFNHIPTYIWMYPSICCLPAYTRHDLKFRIITNGRIIMRVHVYICMCVCTQRNCLCGKFYRSLASLIWEFVFIGSTFLVILPSFFASSSFISRHLKKHFLLLRECLQLLRLFVLFLPFVCGVLLLLLLLLRILSLTDFLSFYFMIQSLLTRPSLS